MWNSHRAWELVLALSSKNDTIVHRLVSIWHRLLTAELGLEPDSHDLQILGSFCVTWPLSSIIWALKYANKNNTSLTEVKLSPFNFQESYSQSDFEHGDQQGICFLWNSPIMNPSSSFFLACSCCAIAHSLLPLLPLPEIHLWVYFSRFITKYFCASKTGLPLLKVLMAENHCVSSVPGIVRSLLCRTTQLLNTTPLWKTIIISLCYLC